MIEAYQADKHRSQLEIWWKQWHLSALSLELLSDTGLIIPEQACLFLYRTNSPIIQFENLVCNKDLSKTERDRAIWSLVAAGKVYAKEHGFKYILLTSNNPNILTRAKEDRCLISSEQYHSILREV